MLNISENSINQFVNLTDFNSCLLLRESRVKRLTLYLLGALLLLLIIFLFLPWTQNIQALGQVTTRSPQQRPQALQSVIGGRIEKWLVQEGDFVYAGDTLVHIYEIKNDYFDPQLVERTQEQVDAKSQSIGVYDEKISALNKQYRALEENMNLKIQQTQNKIIQAQNKISIDSIDLVAYKTNYEIAKNQLEQIQVLHDKRLKSLTELQEKE